MWPEIERAKSENRHELVLGGPEIVKRIQENGLDKAIFTLTSLNYLDIHEANLEEIPDDISKLSSLQSLVLHTNKLKEINTTVTKLDKLKLLDLSHNQIERIQDEIDNLVNIVTLNFSFNHLEVFPRLTKTTKLTVIDLAKNKLKSFPDVCCDNLTGLAELKLSDNEIEVIPPEINCLTSLKELDLKGNKIKTIPGELADCSKLKTLDLKGNPISDRRLLKLIDQCRPKQILDYVKLHSPRITNNISKLNKLKKKEKDECLKINDDDDGNFKHTIYVHYDSEVPRITVMNEVRSVREHVLACIVKNISFNETTFKKFIQVQNKLHDTVCSKRTNSTIATHDFGKLPPGDLMYTTLPPNELMIKALNRPTESTGAELFTRLQNEANNLRKEKKRSTYSGIHKYLYLIEGRSRYPSLLNSQGVVISFPPITNSDVTKIDLQTKTMLIEVTSSESIHLCKSAAESLLKEMVAIFDKDLDVVQMKTVDVEGNVKVTYPAKPDLKFEGGNIKVVRE